MTFRFALQPLLQAREHAEDASRAALRTAARVAAAARDRAADLHSQLAGAAMAGNALHDIELLAAAVARAGALARAAGEREESARTAFADARRACRQITALRERALAAFRQAEELREARAIEEANDARHNANAVAATGRVARHRRSG